MITWTKPYRATLDATFVGNRTTKERGENQKRTRSERTRSECWECGCELIDGAGMHQPYCVKIQ